MLLRGVFSGNAKLSKGCVSHQLYDHRAWLWTFLWRWRGSSRPTMSAKLTLRPAVIWRKLSFGTQSTKGSRFVETILTVVESCHRQSRNSFEYITAAHAGPLQRLKKSPHYSSGCERLRFG